MIKVGIISKLAKNDFLKKNFSNKDGQEAEQEIVALVNDLQTPSENDNVIKNYLAETRWLAHTLKTQPEITKDR